LAAFFCGLDLDDGLRYDFGSGLSTLVGFLAAFLDLSGCSSRFSIFSLLCLRVWTCSEEELPSSDYTGCSTCILKGSGSLAGSSGGFYDSVFFLIGDSHFSKVC
jgi:hypothetical protein